MKYDFDKVVGRSGTDCVKWDHHEMKDEIKDMIPMSIADMDFQAPGHIIDAMLDRTTHAVFGYTVVPESYYASLASWLEKRFFWKVKKDWIRFSPGVIPALNFAIQAFTAPGDKVIIQPPVYHPFRFAISNNGRTVLNNPLKHEDGGYAMDIEGLKNSIDNQTKMLILSSPHNPVGRVWERDELKVLTDICLENDIIIVSDEIHADLVMPGHIHTPAAMLSDEAARITITCTSPSKTFNLAELHVANIIIPDGDLYSRFDLTLTKAGLNKPNVIGMVASEAAYSAGEEWVDELVPYLYRNYLLMRDFVGAHLPKVNVAQMEGTYLGWLDFNGLGEPHQVIEERLLTKARVAMTPGRIFGKGGEGFFRMNLACPRSVLIAALNRIHKAFKS